MNQILVVLALRRTIYKPWGMNKGDHLAFKVLYVIISGQMIGVLEDGTELSHVCYYFCSSLELELIVGHRPLLKGFGSCPWTELLDVLLHQLDEAIFILIE